MNITFNAVLFLVFQVRHNMRQHFLSSATLKLIYDIITWFSTQIAICYTVVPFVLLAVGPSVKFYRLATTNVMLPDLNKISGQILMSVPPHLTTGQRVISVYLQARVM